jgi:hypothetical protein
MIYTEEQSVVQSRSTKKTTIKEPNEIEYEAKIIKDLEIALKQTKKQSRYFYIASWVIVTTNI